MVRAKKTDVKNQNEEKIACGGCGKLKKKAEFFISYNDIHKSGKLPYCKDCILKMSSSDDGEFDLDRFKNVLRQLDRPFLYDIYIKSFENPSSIKGGIGVYFKNIALPQSRYLKWENSILLSSGNMNVNNDTNTAPEKRIVPEELRLKWGKEYNYNQISRLENFYEDMKKSYKVETASHKDYLIKISKVSLKMDESLDRDNVGEFQKLSSVYDTLMKSAKFTAVQRSAVDDTGGFATFSEFIESLEREGFIEPAKIEEDYDIVEATISDIKKYTRNLVLGDTSISTLAQETLLKMQMKHDEELEGETDE